MLETLFADWSATTTFMLLLGLGLGWELVDIRQELRDLHQTLTEIKNACVPDEYD